jgi:hypothetical protein
MAEQGQVVGSRGEYRSPPYAFWLVVTAIGAVVLIFVLSMVFFGLVRNLFTTPDQVIAALTTAFAVIGTLVGSYFGIKASGDARSGIEEARKDTQALADRVLDQATTTEGTTPRGGGTPSSSTTPPGEASPPPGTTTTPG